jgi:biopolymer transport protein ExbB
MRIEDLISSTRGRWKSAGQRCAVIASLIALSTAVALISARFVPMTAWAQSASSAPAASGGSSTGGLLEAVTGSGFVGVIIILCSIAGLSLVIAFAVQIRNDALVPPDLLEHLDALLEDESFEEVHEACAQQPCFLSSVVTSALERADEGYEAMAEAMMESAEFESTKLHQKIGYLSVLANVSPMLGLLGTVQGMIGAFATLATSEVSPKPKDLAGDISVALGTTFLGLIVAIPLTAIFVFFRNRVIRITTEVIGTVEEMLARFKPGK